MTEGGHSSGVLLVRFHPSVRPAGWHRPSYLQPARLTALPTTHPDREAQRALPLGGRYRAMRRRARGRVARGIDAETPGLGTTCAVVLVASGRKGAFAMRRTGRMVCVACLISLSGLPSAQAAKPDWQMVAETSDFSLWVDAASLQKEGNIVKVWAKLEFKTAQPIYRGSAKMKRSDRRHDYVDCFTRASALKSAASFSESNLHGAQVARYESDASDMEWEQVTPNSVAAVILEFACARASAQ